MEKDVKAKADDVLAREIRDLKEAMRNLQTTRGNKSLDDPHTHLRAYCDKLVGVERYERLKKKSTKTFHEYALRWRSEAARVQPPMSESEMTSTFIECQDSGIYYEKMITIMGQKFTEIIRMGEILKEGIKLGRIQDFTALQTAGKAIQYGSINGNKKKMYMLS
ncbi:hypothetical protein KY285_030713 [Solanum tuberosum]|nr:hypothetical protein KY285_030713 [Solanum tuberosum]